MASLVSRAVGFQILNKQTVISNNLAQLLSLSDISEARNTELRRDVINLYKNLIYLSREWPTDLKPQIKRAFMRNRDVHDPEEIRKMIARGEYVCREIIATYHLRKYRAMKRRYYSEDRERQLEEMFKSFNS